MDGIFVRVRSLLAVDKQLEFEGEEREGYSMAIGLIFFPQDWSTV